MQTLKTISVTLTQLDLKIFSHEVIVRVMPKGDGFLLQVECRVENVCTNKPYLAKGAKYYISSHAIKSEVVGTAFKAFQDFVIHEVREGFRYKKKRIYGPHYSVDELHSFARHTQTVKRK